MSSELGHISGGELAQIGQIAGGDVHLSAAVYRNLSAQAWRLSERGGVLTADTRPKALGDVPSLLGAAGALRRTLELLHPDSPEHAHAPGAHAEYGLLGQPHARRFDAQSCTSLASLILWCDFVSALLFVLGCG